MNPPEPLLVQGVAFAVAGLTGVALGLGVDAYRGVLRALTPPRWLRHVLDVLCVALALPPVAAGLLAANWGELRVYPLLGLALGATLYLALGSPVLLPAWTWCLRGLLRLVAAILRNLSWPVRAPLAAALRQLRHLRRSEPPGTTSPP
jgi:spore cortex biosynthesis protein YabQ